MLEYNKTSQVIMEIVKDLFTLNVGDKMKSVRAYVKMLESSQGTVQNAINYLVDEGAIAIDKRGSLGSFLVKFDKNKIFKLIGKQHIIGCMPLPYSKRYEGLASGLSGLGTEDIRFHLSYMRGSTNRISNLIEGSVDYAVTSHAAALKEIEMGKKISIVKSFGPTSFVSKHVLVKSTQFDGQINENTVLGIDKTSIDQIEIARLIKKQMKVKIKFINASLIRKYLDNGEIDMTVWNFDEILEKHLNYDYEELNFVDGLSIFTETVIVIRSNDYFMKRIIEDEVSSEDIIAIQKAVINGTQVPIY